MAKVVDGVNLGTLPFISYPDRQGKTPPKIKKKIEEATMSICCTQDTDRAFSWLMHNLSVLENLPIS